MIAFSAFLQALLLAPFVLGMGSTFIFLRRIDLAPEGSLVLGACVFSQTIHATDSYFIALIAAVLAGMCVGTFTVLIQLSKRIWGVLASLITLYILYGINLLVLGKPSTTLYRYAIPCFGYFKSHSEQRMLAAIINFLLLCAVCFLLSGRMGLRLRAFGSNTFLSSRLGYSEKLLTFVGFMLCNGLAAFSGAQIAIVSKYVDVNMGIGHSILGITTCIIGQTLLQFKKKSYSLLALQSIFGLFCYCTLIQYLVIQGFDPKYFKIVTGLIITATLLCRRKAHVFS